VFSSLFRCVDLKVIDYSRGNQSSWWETIFCELIPANWSHIKTIWSNMSTIWTDNVGFGYFRQRTSNSALVRSVCQSVFHKVCNARVFQKPKYILFVSLNNVNSCKPLIIISSAYRLFSLFMITYKIWSILLNKRVKFNLTCNKINSNCSCLNFRPNYLKTDATAQKTFTTRRYTPWSAANC